MQCCCSTASYVNFPHHLCSHPLLRNSLHMVSLAVLRGGQELLPLKVAPIQPSVTAAFHLQSWRDSDCQMWELGRDTGSRPHQWLAAKCRLTSIVCTNDPLMGGHHLEQGTSTKYLGVSINKHIQWSTEINTHLGQTH